MMVNQGESSQVMNRAKFIILPTSGPRSRVTDSRCMLHHQSSTSTTLRQSGPCPCILTYASILPELETLYWRPKRSRLWKIQLFNMNIFIQPLTTQDHSITRDCPNNRNTRDSSYVPVPWRVPCCSRFCSRVHGSRPPPVPDPTSKLITTDESSWATWNGVTSCDSTASHEHARINKLNK